MFFEGMNKRDLTKINNEELPYTDNFNFFNEYKKLNRYEFIFVDAFNKIYYRNLKEKLNNNNEIENNNL